MPGFRGRSAATGIGKSLGDCLGWTSIEYEAADGPMPMKTRKWLFFALTSLVMLPGLMAGSWILAESAIEATSGQEFCSAFLTMRPFAETYALDVHDGNNPRGLTTACIACHLPHDSPASYLSRFAHFESRALGLHTQPLINGFRKSEQADNARLHRFQWGHAVPVRAAEADHDQADAGKGSEHRLGGRPGGRPFGVSRVEVSAFRPSPAMPRAP